MISMRECVSFVILVGLLIICFKPFRVKTFLISGCALFFIQYQFTSPKNNGLFVFTNTNLYHFIKFLLEIFVKVSGGVWWTI